MIKQILRLEFILKHWDELALTENKTHLGVRTTHGICANCDLESLDDKWFRDVVEQYVDANKSTSFPIKDRLCNMYPVGGYNEYVSTMNKFTNPDRKTFAIWVLDNIKWRLNGFQKLMLKIERNRRKNATELWAIEK